MRKLLAIYGSPRRKGNTTALLDQAMQGAVEAGTEVEKRGDSSKNLPFPYFAPNGIFAE